MRAKPGELKMYWSKRERDLMIDNGGGGACRADAHLLHTAVCSERLATSIDVPLGQYVVEKSLVDELEARGYDLATLRLSIRLKQPG